MWLFGVSPENAVRIVRIVANIRYKEKVASTNGSGVKHRATTLGGGGEAEINDALRLFSEYEKVCNEIIATENKLERLKEEKEKYAPVIRALQLVREAARGAKSVSTST